MREPEVITIGDHTYEIKPLATSAMLKLMTRLARLLGPSVGALQNPSDLASFASVGRILAELSERFEEADVLSVCAVLAAQTMIVEDDKKLHLGGERGAQWETHFAGDPVGLFRWLGAAMEVNFGPLVAWLAEASKAKAVSAAGTAK